MRLELLQQDVAWNFEQAVRYEEDRECSVVLVSFEKVEFFAQAVHVGVSDVDTIQEREDCRMSVLLFNV